MTNSPYDPPAPALAAAPSPRYEPGAASWSPHGDTPQNITPPARTRLNYMAVASMALGLLWIGGIASVLAVILGHVSLRKIGRSGQGGRGSAIAGIALGYLGLAAAVIPRVIAATHG